MTVEGFPFIQPSMSQTRPLATAAICEAAMALSRCPSVASAEPALSPTVHMCTVGVLCVTCVVYTCCVDQVLYVHVLCVHVCCVYTCDVWV